MKRISDKSTWKEGSFPINKDVQNAIRKKHSTHRRWMATRNRNDAEQKRIEYAKARNKVSKLMRKAKRNFEKDIATKCKTNPKTFWSHVRRKLKTRSGIVHLLEDTRDKSSMKYLDLDKAKILQQQFSSVFTKEPKGSVPRLDERTNNLIEHLQETEEQVKSEINRLNINKCCGPDHIHSRLLKELVNYLSKPIALLINKSINEGMVPKDWKKAIVSPIYKKGSKHLAENYCPISLTSIVCKLVETLIKKSHHETSGRP